MQNQYSYTGIGQVYCYKSVHAVKVKSFMHVESLWTAMLIKIGPITSKNRTYKKQRNYSSKVLHSTNNAEILAASHPAAFRS